MAVQGLRQFLKDGLPVAQLWRCLSASFFGLERFPGFDPKLRDVPHVLGITLGFGSGGADLPHLNGAGKGLRQMTKLK